MALLAFVFLGWSSLSIVSSTVLTSGSDETLLIEWNITSPFVIYLKNQTTKQTFSSNTTSYFFGGESIQFNVATYYHNPINRYIFVIRSSVFTQWIQRISTNVTLSINELNFKEQYNYMIFDHRDPNNPNKNYRSKIVSFPTKIESLYDKLNEFTQDHISIKCEIKMNAVDIDDSKNIWYLQAIPYRYKLPVFNPEIYSDGLRSPYFHVSMDIGNYTYNENEAEFSMDSYKYAFNVIMQDVHFMITCLPSQDEFQLHLNGFISNENITEIEGIFSFFIPQFHFLLNWSTFTFTKQESSGEIERWQNRNVFSILRERYRKIAKKNADFTIECRIMVLSIRYKNGPTSGDLENLEKLVEEYRRKNEL